MTEGFKSVRILDNFYQTSSFFPMPVLLMCTTAESGQMNLGPYSLCFPYAVAGERRQMVFNCRDNSNTGMNLKRTGLCTINFIPDNRSYMRNCVLLGYPGETTEEKMKQSIFTLVPTQRAPEEREQGRSYPDVVREAVQVFECSLASHEIDESIHSMRCILTIEKILLKEHWHTMLVEGKRRFPNLPVDYGFRNNAHFWFTRHSPPYAEAIPKGKATSVDSVMYAITRGGFAEDLAWDTAAAEKLVSVPRVFIGIVLKGISDEARKAGVSRITPEFVDAIRDKRASERGRG